SSELYFMRDHDRNHTSSDGKGIVINGGNFIHNNSTVIITNFSSYSDSREIMTINDDVTFYNLILDPSIDSGNSEPGGQGSNVKIENNVIVTVENDLRIKNGRFRSGSSSNRATIIVRG